MNSQKDSKGKRQRTSISKVTEALDDSKASILAQSREGVVAPRYKIRRYITYLELLFDRILLKCVLYLWSR